MNKFNFSDTEKVSQLFQEAVDKAIEKHRLRGESIAISDDEGNIKVVPASEIQTLLRENVKNQIK